MSVGDGAIDNKFCLKEGGSRRACVLCIVESVAPNGEADSVLFVLERAVVADEISVGSFGVDRYG